MGEARRYRVEVVFTGTADTLARLLRGLVSNAHHYGHPDESIIVRVELDDEEGDHEWPPSNGTA